MFCPTLKTPQEFFFCCLDATGRPLMVTQPIRAAGVNIYTFARLWGLAAPHFVTSQRQHYLVKLSGIL